MLNISKQGLTSANFKNGLRTVLKGIIVLNGFKRYIEKSNWPMEEGGEGEGGDVAEEATNEGIEGGGSFKHGHRL